MAKKIRCPYSFPHKSRKAMVDYLCSIGGYSRFNDGSYPIEFCVATYDADFDFDHLWKTYGPDSGECWLPEFPTPEHAAAYYRLAFRLHEKNQEHLWSWGQEDAYRSLSEGDTYQMLWDGTPCRVKLELHGRGGKHLVIAEFDGTCMDSVRSDDLEQMLATEEENDYGWCWSFAQVKKFYRYVRQCEVDFTTKTASKEVEYQGAFCFFNNIVNSEWEAEVQRISDHNDVVAAGQTIQEALASIGDSTEVAAAFATLCRSAGIGPDEITY